jgi:hypothetical protein
LCENGRNSASALIHLKTAETIISILSADLKINSELDMSAEVKLKSSEWSIVKCKNGVCNQGKTRNIKNSMSHSATANPFAPLEHLEEIQPVTLSTNNEKQHNGRKITTVVNGIINKPRENIRPKKKTKDTSRRTSPLKTLDSDTMRHVRIIGDSHLKGSSRQYKQHLHSQFDVSNIIKPGA